MLKYPSWVGFFIGSVDAASLQNSMNLVQNSSQATPSFEGIASLTSLSQRLGLQTMLNHGAGRESPTFHNSISSPKKFTDSSVTSFNQSMARRCGSRNS